MERPSIIKDKAVLAYVEYLENKISKYETSYVGQTYLTIRSQINSFNEQLTISDKPVKKPLYNKEGEVVTQVDIYTGRIDLFADKDAKEFDRAWKYMLESVELNKKVDELYKMLNPEQQKEVEKALKEKNIGMAEKLAMKAQNG